MCLHCITYIRSTAGAHRASSPALTTMSCNGCLAAVCPIMCPHSMTPGSLARMEGKLGCRRAHSHGGHVHQLPLPPILNQPITLLHVPLPAAWHLSSFMLIKTVLFWHFSVPDASEKVKFKTIKILWRNLQKMMTSFIIPQKLISLYSYLFIHTSVIFNNGNSGRHRPHLNTALFFCQVP